MNSIIQDYNYIKTFNFKTINSFLQELLNIGFTYSTELNISHNFYNIKNVNFKNIFKKKYYFNLKSYKKNININNYNYNYVDWLSIYNKFLIYFEMLSPYSNSLYDLFLKGAKGSKGQIFQLLHFKNELKDLLQNKLNWILTQNYFKGFLLEDFITNCISNRKGILSTSLETAAAGTLTKKLYEFNQDIIIKEQFCYSLNLIKEYKFTINLIGSFSSIPLFYNKLKKNDELDRNININTINRSNINSYENIDFYFYKSILTCNSLVYPCFNCLNLKKKKQLISPYPLGLITSHTISEPCTQLNLSLFHTGGVTTSKESEEDDLILPKLDSLITNSNYNINKKTNLFKKNFLNKFYFIKKINKNLKINNNIKSINFYNKIWNNKNIIKKIINNDYLNSKYSNNDIFKLNYNNIYILFKTNTFYFKKINLKKKTLSLSINIYLNKLFKYNILNLNNRNIITVLNNNINLINKDSIII